MRKRWLILFIVFYLIILFSSRNPLILDDVYDDTCIDKVSKADIVYVIPFDFSDDFCDSMKGLNKTFGLHGITHDYHEFLGEIDEEDLLNSIEEFEDCFGYEPTIFRPPYNKISKENEELIENYNMTVYKKSYFLHPYCHCNPSGWMKPLNWFIFC